MLPCILSNFYSLTRTKYVIVFENFEKFDERLGIASAEPIVTKLTKDFLLPQKSVFLPNNEEINLYLLLVLISEQSETLIVCKAFFSAIL